MDGTNAEHQTNERTPMEPGKLPARGQRPTDLARSRGSSQDPEPKMRREGDQTPGHRERDEPSARREKPQDGTPQRYTKDRPDDQKAAGDERTEQGDRSKRWQPGQHSAPAAKQAQP